MKKIVVAIIVLVAVMTTPAFALDTHDVEQYFEKMEITTILESDHSGTIVFEVNDADRHVIWVHSDGYNVSEVNVSVMKGNGEYTYDRMASIDWWDQDVNGLLLGIYYGLL